MEEQVILYPVELLAEVCGEKAAGNSPTELYVHVMEVLLRRYPELVGKKETHFTSDSVRAGQYTGTTRSVQIGGRTVYIKTGFSTKDKWKGIEKTCQLVDVGFAVREGTAACEEGTAAQKTPQAEKNPLTGRTMEEEISRRYPNPTQQPEQTAESVYTEDCKRAFSKLYDEQKAKDPTFGEGLSKDVVVQIMMEVYQKGCQNEGGEQVDAAAKSTSPEPVDKTLNFAYHNEYYLTRRMDSSVCRGATDFGSAVLDSSGCWYNGYIYLNGNRVRRTSWNQNTLFKIAEDGSVKAIVSKSKYFQGEIAVNRHGIFRREGKKLYLFDEEGNLLSKITTGVAAAIYIYDDRVYVLNSKGVLYQYDIFNREEGKVIWKLSECREHIDDQYSEYLSVVSPQKYASEKGKCRFKLGDLYDGQRVCANDQHIIVGIRIHNSSVYFRIDPETYAWSILDIFDDSTTSRYAQNCPPGHVDRGLYRIFSFDMKESLIWWCREVEHGDLKLFAAPIQPKLPQETIANPPYSYYLPKTTCFKNYYEHRHGFFNLANLYFDGKSASANDTMSTVYVYPDGRCAGFNTSYQTNVSSIFGKWMYRGNMGNDSHSGACFVPHDGDTIAEPYESKQCLWIKEETFVEAYEKATGKK